jgi:hypothetical protein
VYALLLAERINMGEGKGFVSVSSVVFFAQWLGFKDVLYLIEMVRALDESFNDAQNKVTQRQMKKNKL